MKNKVWSSLQLPACSIRSTSSTRKAVLVEVQGRPPEIVIIRNSDSVQPSRSRIKYSDYTEILLRRNGNIQVQSRLIKWMNAHAGGRGQQHIQPLPQRSNEVRFEAI